jgi:excisionase family DNA binding protein
VTRIPLSPVEQLLTADMVAERLRVSVRTVRRWNATGLLPATRIGRSVRLRQDDVNRLIRSGIA